MDKSVLIYSISYHCEYTLNSEFYLLVCETCLIVLFLFISSYLGYFIKKCQLRTKDILPEKYFFCSLLCWYSKNNYQNRRSVYNYRLISFHYRQVQVFIKGHHITFLRMAGHCCKYIHL